MQENLFIHGLKSIAEWGPISQVGNRPDHIPSTPGRTYKNKGQVIGLIGTGRMQLPVECKYSIVPNMNYQSLPYTLAFHRQNQNRFDYNTWCVCVCTKIDSILSTKLMAPRSTGSVGLNTQAYVIQAETSLTWTNQLQHMCRKGRFDSTFIQTLRCAAINEQLDAVTKMESSDARKSAVAAIS